MAEKPPFHTLEYWYHGHVSLLGYARLIKSKLPPLLRLFARVFVEDAILDTHSQVIRVYYSYTCYSDIHVKNRFCYEFTLDALEKAANGDNVITTNTPAKIK